MRKHDVPSFQGFSVLRIGFLVWMKEQIFITVPREKQSSPGEETMRKGKYFLFRAGILGFIVVLSAGTKDASSQDSFLFSESELSNPEYLNSSLLNRPDSKHFFHHAEDCTVCHCSPSPNLADVCEIISTPNGGDREVIFTSRTGAHSFADGDETYDGVCEVCHTQTNHHRHDGQNPDPDSHYAGEDCAICHAHEDEFTHGGGQECIVCHGHDPDYEYAPGQFSQGAGTHYSHSTHTEGDADDLKGPDLTCGVCHDTDNFPYFISGMGEPPYDLTETDVCDLCHSPGGSYDGLDDPEYGARFNWNEGIYIKSKTLRPGKEKWCASCHDEEPANSKTEPTGVWAPSVIGDETAPTQYGTGYGYYKTGHGLPADQTYPATGSNGAALGCTECHDPAVWHIDYVHRTYEPETVYLIFNPISEYYMNGFRLKPMDTGYDGIYPMHIPRTGHVYPPGFREDWEFALCFKCHDSDALFDGGDPASGAGGGTDFRAVSDGTPGYGGHPQPESGAWYSLHDVHTWGANGPVDSEMPQYDSDFDGTADSRISCPACHNVHGSPSPAMIRHGELISSMGTADKVPAVDFQYTPEASYPSLLNSTGGQTRFIGTGPGDVSKNGICNMCHNDATVYSRTPLILPVPQASNLAPPNNAVNLPLDAELSFTLSQEAEGIDWTTFSIELSGDQAYYQLYTDEDASVVSATGTPQSYDVTVNPDENFNPGEVITVIINVDDLANPAHSLIQPTWVFTAEPDGQGTVRLHPTGISDNTGEFSVMNGSWETVLDVNDGDVSYAHRCCGPPVYHCSLHMDDPIGLDDATIDSITIYIYSRFLDGAWPDALPVTGYLKLGYKTGSAMVWSYPITVAESSDHVPVNSDIYYLDSDGGTLDLDDINNLEIGVTRYIGGPMQMRITELYAEIAFTPLD